MRINHLTGMNNCFDYSINRRGVFCTSCVLFGGSVAGGNNLGKFVSFPQDNYTNLTGKDGALNIHMRKKFHQVNAMKASEFSKIIRNDSGDVH